MSLLAVALSLGSPVLLLSDVWCPHTCEAQAERPGYLVEVARAAMADGGEAAPLPYRVMTWTRVLSDAAAAKRPMLVLGVGRGVNAARWRFIGQPIARSPQCFYTRGDSPWTYRRPEDLHGRVLGVTQGYHFTPELNALLEARPPRLKLHRVSSENAAPRHLSMLAMGRSEVVLEDRLVMRWQLQQQPQPVREAGCLQDPDEGVYIAVPREAPGGEALLQRLEEGLQRLRRSGALSRILDRYAVPPDAR